MLNRHNKFTLGVFMILAAIVAAIAYVHTKTVAILQPAGPIAAQEKHLLIVAVLLMLIVVIPVFVLLFAISWKYRAENTASRYTPDWDRHAGYEAIWWTVPMLLILALSIITWKSSHTLDPSRALVSDIKPLTVQVVALQWKWLFIYPDQRIATVNYLQFPKNTPVNFEITSDATMNSFWIPQLGGQIYAMAGMTTQLHLMADRTGSFRGDSANISGTGFAGMNFTARATSSYDFDNWVRTVQQSRNKLTDTTYTDLALPSQNNRPVAYSLQAQGLYDTIIVKSAGMGGMTMSDPAETATAQ